MRLEAQAKSGYYPLDLAIVPHIASKIECSSKATIFDPCCGKGDAVLAIAEAVGIDPANVYAAEMDEGRHAEAKTRIQNCFGPVDWLESPSCGNASIFYVNPPFDDELGGGGRVEWRFLQKIANQATQGSILIAILPKRTAESWRTFEVLSRYYDRLRCAPYPFEAKFSEWVVFGVRRKFDGRADWGVFESTYCCKSIDLIPPYSAADGGCVRVEKRFYTPQEIEVAIRGSKADEILKLGHATESRQIVPPMRLSKGHIALLLASGMLDGIVEPPGEKPHVVRGSTRKIVTESTVKEDKKVKVHKTEQIKLTVKIATEDGIVMLEDKIENEAEQAPEEEEVEESDEGDC
ncbi:DUF6094 domain-containing protein [Pirellulaceae bacterium SH501]